MIAGNYQVADVLMLVGCMAPIAIYFLTLGLVNSHSRPYLISSRADFASLSIALAPLLIFPIPTFAKSGIWWLPLLGFAVVAFAFWWMLPSRRAGFVIYNISEKRGSQLLADTLDQLGWAGSWEGRTWSSDNRRLRVTITSFAMLRNVSVHLESVGRESDADIAALQSALERRISLISQLPSTMGACLVITGVGLMILPMWMVSRHIDDLVDAMSHLFG